MRGDPKTIILTEAKDANVLISAWGAIFGVNCEDYLIEILCGFINENNLQIDLRDYLSKRDNTTVPKRPE